MQLAKETQEANDISGSLNTMSRAGSDRQEIMYSRPGAVTFICNRNYPGLIHVGVRNLLGIKASLEDMALYANFKFHIVF